MPINIGQLMFMILQLEPVERAIVTDIVKGWKGKDSDATRKALEAGLRLEFEVRQRAKKP